MSSQVKLQKRNNSLSSQITRDQDFNNKCRQPFYQKQNWKKCLFSCLIILQSLPQCWNWLNIRQPMKSRFRSALGKKMANPFDQHLQHCEVELPITCCEIWQKNNLAQKSAEFAVFTIETFPIAYATSMFTLAAHIIKHQYNLCLYHLHTNQIDFFWYIALSHHHNTNQTNGAAGRWSWSIGI